MSNTLNIFCHLERIGPRYVDGMVDFWLCLSAGYETADPVDEEKDLLPLRSWLWPAWTDAGIALYDGTTYAPIAGAVILDTDPTARLTKVHARLEAQFRQAITTKDRGSFLQASANPAEIEINDDSKPAERIVRWSGLLAQTATYPAGLGVMLRTSICLRLPADLLTPGIAIVAAPIFGSVPGGRLLNRVPDPPSSSTFKQIGSTGRYRWSYKPATGLGDIQAIVQPVAVHVIPGKDEFVDFATLYRSNLKLDDAAAYDWTERLESRLADAFDLPKIMIEIIRDLLPKPQQNPGDWIPAWIPDPAFGHLFLSALRDGASLGYQPGIGGDRLALRILRETDLTSAIEDTDIAAADRIALFPPSPLPTPSPSPSWTELLRQVLPAQADTKLPDLTTVPLGELLPKLTAYLGQLEFLYAVVATPDLHRRLVMAQWKEVRRLQVPGQPPLPSTALAVIETRLEQSHPDLRREMLLACLAPAYRELRGNFTTKGGELAINIAAAVEQYIRTRADPATSGLYGNFHPRIATTPANIAKQVTMAGIITKGYVESRVVPRSYDADKPELVAEGMVIPIGDIRPDADESSTAANQVRERIAGAGVLIRRKKGPWHYLNYATLVDSTDTPILKDPVTIPSNLSVRNGIRFGQVVYLNRPLVGDVPGNQPVDPIAEIDDKNGLNESLFGYKACYVPDGPRLLGAEYGVAYQVLVHYTGKGGHLPEAIAAGKRTDTRRRPWEMKPLGEIGSPDGASILDLMFTRRVGIAAVRTEHDSAKRVIDQAVALRGLPPIPDGVAPIARAILARRSPEDPKSDGPTASAPGLILLVPPKAQESDVPKAPWLKTGITKFTFPLRPPTVAYDVWQRWFGFSGPESAKIRAFVRFKSTGDNPMLGRNDVYSGEPIDDFAVTHFELRLTVLWPSEADPIMPVTAPVLKRMPIDASKLDMDMFQAPAYAVTVRAVTTGRPMITPLKDGEIEVLIPEGYVCKLAIRPICSEGDESRFHTALWKKVAPSTDPNNPPSSHGEISMLIEVATTWQNTQTLAAKLSGWLKHDPATLADNALKLHFAPEDVDRFLMHRVDLHLQRWRWDGRPVYRVTSLENPAEWACGYPFAAPPVENKDNPGELLGGEPHDNPPDHRDALLFAQRGPDDCYVIGKTVEYIAPDQREKANAIPPTLIHRQSLANLPGALYFRVGVTVRSRYAPLLEAGHASIRSTESFDGIRNPAPDGSDPRRNGHIVPGWKRIALRSRWIQPLQAPAVKLVIPLTAAAEPRAGARASDPQEWDAVNAGFLVVLDEPWYTDTCGGLAERLASELVSVALPDSPGTTRPQFGPDPIVDLPLDSVPLADVRLPSPVGAFGHTFDTDTEAPLFVRSSFLQPAPMVSDDVRDLSWHFLQLRFRREIDPAGVSDEVLKLGIDLGSRWTEPIWAQLLPPSNRLIVAEQRGEELEPLPPISISLLSFDVQTAQLMHSGTGRIVVPVPTNSRSFSYAALLTMIASDAFGRLDRERFSQLVLWDHIQDVLPVLKKGGRRLRLRLVELQHRPDDLRRIQQATDLCELLFPKDGEPLARVVRISLPIQPR